MALQAGWKGQVTLHVLLFHGVHHEKIALTPHINLPADI